MIAAILFAAAAPAATPPPPEVAQAIVVTRRKLKTWKGGVSKVGGKMVCKTRKSSGDKALDAIRCGAMLTCFKTAEPRIDTLMSSKLPAREKKLTLERIGTELVPCIEDYEDAAVLRLAREKAGA